MKWILIILLIGHINNSWELCISRKKIMMTPYSFNIQRLMYSYIICDEIADDFDYKQDLLPILNTTTQLQYIQFVNSTIPEIAHDPFGILNVAELRINQAGALLIKPYAFADANITLINFDNNEIHTIYDKSFYNTSVIKILSFKNNSLREILPHTFEGLLDLRHLNLEKNLINFVNNESFQHLASLEELNLSYNFIRQLEESTFKLLERLQTIWLNNNLLKEINKNIFIHNKYLQYVNIHNNMFTNLDATSFSKSILFINATNNKLTNINFTNLDNINDIDISSNYLRYLNETAFKNLKNLEILNIGNNQIGSSYSITRTFKLKQLNMENNAITNLDTNIFSKNVYLENLVLSNNHLKTINFVNCSDGIKKIILNNNSIKEIFNLSKLHQLEYLDVGYNFLTSLNYTLLKDLYNLRYFIINNNHINNLELGAFRNLGMLRVFNLSFNNISSLPTGIFNGVSKLNQLDLSHNNIIKVDEHIFLNTPELFMLNISNNNLDTANIKKIISHTSWLKEINVNGNNWSCSALVDLSKSSIHIRLTQGTNFEVENVFGIACMDNSNHKKNEDMYLTNINTIILNIQALKVDMAYYLKLIVWILLILFLIIIVKVFYTYFGTYVASKTQFSYKGVVHQQEIQLM